MTGIRRVRCGLSHPANEYGADCDCYAASADFGNFYASPNRPAGNPDGHGQGHAQNHRLFACKMDCFRSGEGTLLLVNNEEMSLMFCIVPVSKRHFQFGAGTMALRIRSGTGLCRQRPKKPPSSVPLSALQQGVARAVSSLFLVHADYRVRLVNLSHGSGRRARRARVHRERPQASTTPAPSSQGQYRLQNGVQIVPVVCLRSTRGNSDMHPRIAGDALMSISSPFIRRPVATLCYCCRGHRLALWGTRVKHHLADSWALPEISFPTTAS